jgi:hypothetical protein
MTKDALHYAEPKQRKNAPLAPLARWLLQFAILLAIMTSALVIAERLS